MSALKTCPGGESELARRLREAEARCAALEALLREGAAARAPLREDAETIPLAKALDERRREYPETSPCAVSRFAHFARRLVAATGGENTRLADVSRAHVEAVLAPAATACTYNGLLASARAFFAWCIRRRLLGASPAADVEGRTEAPREPHFFTPAQVRAVFREAVRPDADPAIGVFLALGFFCGMRTSEIARARAKDIDLDGGTVRVPVPKGYWRGTPPRLIQAPENAIAWLRWLLPRGGLPPDTPLAASLATVRDWKRVRLGPLGLAWDSDFFRNVMRHTACTMHVAAFRNLAETQLLLGHSAGSAITARHYLGLAPRAMGEEYWRIVPPSRPRHHPATRRTGDEEGAGEDAGTMAAWAGHWAAARGRPCDDRFLILRLDDCGRPLPLGPGRAFVRPDGTVAFGTDAMA